nr:hypothetical protein [Tanacetum cinerariifolium]
MSKVLQERGIRGLPGSTEPNLRDHVKSISTAKADSSKIRRMRCSPYAISGSQRKSMFSETVPKVRIVLNFIKISKKPEEDGVVVSNSLYVSVSISRDTRCDSFASYDDNASSYNSLKTPKSVIHHVFIDTPGGSVYWVPRVFANVLQVLGAVYENLEECIDMYGKYASEAGLVEGCPKDVSLNTLVPKKNDRQVRSSNFRICGCKARVVFDMLFIIKVANAIIGAVKAYNLYTGLKGSSSLVHGTQTEFRNLTRVVNCFIGDSDAQMLITRMEERQ